MEIVFYDALNLPHAYQIRDVEEKKSIEYHS